MGDHLLTSDSAMDDGYDCDLLDAGGDIDGQAAVDCEQLLIQTVFDSRADASDSVRQGAAPAPIGIGDISEFEQLPVETAGSTDPTLTTDHTMVLMRAELDRKKMGGHQMESMSLFYREGLEQIITKVFVIADTLQNLRDATPEDNQISQIQYRVIPVAVKPERPTVSDRTGKSQPFTPNNAIQQNATLNISLKADFDIRATAILKDGGTIERSQSLNNVLLSHIPCCVGSEMCHTYGMTPEALKSMREDPIATRGYFILRGNMWNIDVSENLTNNTLHVYKNEYRDEVARATFLSKPGDGYENSYQIILKLLNTGAIVLELTLNKDDKISIPFYIMFRSFGMTSDVDIIDNIVHGVNSETAVAKQLKKLLEQAFRVRDPRFAHIENETNPMIILHAVANEFKTVADQNAARKKKSVQQYLVQLYIGIIDKIFFPHIGVSPADRYRKLKFLAHNIRELLMVYSDIMPSTNRDSYANKRVHPAGIAFAKAFKTRFNINVVHAIKHKMSQVFTSTPFSQVQLAGTVSAAILGSKLESSLVQAMAPVNKANDRQQTASRITPTQLYLKNDLNASAALNTITASTPPVGKSNQRALQMRQNHPSHDGFICKAASTDTGETVGLNKQLGVSASISGAQSSDLLRSILMADSALIADIEPSEISARQLAIVLVNGMAIGHVPDSHQFVYKYRMARRRGLIHRRVSIVWDIQSRKVSFWTDYGRIHRPLLIVYNNIAEYKAAARAGKPIGFKQWIGLRMEHITGLQRGTVKMEHLEEQGIIEYISCEEQLNAFIAPALNAFRKEESNVLLQFTHVDDPRALYGPAALAAPMPDKSNAVRITMETNHRKQASGWFALNYPYLAIKNTTLAHYVDTPLVTTFSDGITTPTGQNVMVALMLHQGHNVEDSIHCNATSVARGMYNVTQYNVEKAKQERNTKFQMPNREATAGIKHAANYSKISGVTAAIGSQLRENDVIIVKVAIKPKATPGSPAYVDQSVVYQREEEARVVDIIRTRDADEEELIKVKIGAFRPLNDGDKLSSRTGNKGIVAKLSPASDMPYTENGEYVDLIVNCHSIPTRMALNQMCEAALGLIAAHRGAFIDASAFKEINVLSIDENLSSLGLKYAGHQRLYSGLTGEPLDALIFVGPTHYMRLEKFVIDEQYANRGGPTNALTHQPLAGKASNGGLKVGEMEKDTLTAQGAMQVLQNKFYTDSDGISNVMCTVCGEGAIYNDEISLYRCKKCKDKARFVRVPTSWTANLLHHRLSAMGVKVKYHFD